MFVHFLIWATHSYDNNTVRPCLTQHSTFKKQQLQDRRQTTSARKTTRVLSPGEPYELQSMRRRRWPLKCLVNMWTRHSPATSPQTYSANTSVDFSIPSTLTRAHAHTNTKTHTNTQTHTHRRTHKHTHTHTHTRARCLDAYRRCQNAHEGHLDAHQHWPNVHKCCLEAHERCPKVQ